LLCLVQVRIEGSQLTIIFVMSCIGWYRR